MTNRTHTLTTVDLIVLSALFVASLVLNVWVTGDRNDAVNDLVRERRSGDALVGRLSEGCQPYEDGSADCAPGVWPLVTP